jgi:uncharacterized membrane protein (UPF0182 family)
MALDQERVKALPTGLARLFSGAAPAPAAAGAAEPSPAVGPSDGGAVDLTRQAGELYQSAVAAQRAGDWARYGADLARLGEVLRQLQATLGGRRP